MTTQLQAQLDQEHREVVMHLREHGLPITDDRHHATPPFDPVPVLQLTDDDLGGRFPWDPGCANEAWTQPRPGTFSA